MSQVQTCIRICSTWNMRGVITKKPKGEDSETVGLPNLCVGAYFVIAELLALIHASVITLTVAGPKLVSRRLYEFGGRRCVIASYSQYKKTPPAVRLMRLVYWFMKGSFVQRSDTHTPRSPLGVSEYCFAMLNRLRIVSISNFA